MNKGLLKSVLVVSAIFGVCIVLGIGQAQATLINATGISDPDNDSVQYFTDLIGEQAYLLDKDEFDDPPVGTTDLEGYLHVEITNFTSPGGADISWDLSGTDWIARYVAVKDGNANQSDIFWVQYEVASDQKITGTGTVSTALNGNGAISHVSLYGTRGTSVPDASIMLLLGSSFLGFSVFSRKRKRS